MDLGSAEKAELAVQAHKKEAIESASDKDKVQDYEEFLIR